MNRAIWEEVAEAKDVCKAKSLDMDVADLRLQNLQYEKNHLVRQIRHCRDFHFDDSTVQLLPYISPISPLDLPHFDESSGQLLDAAAVFPLHPPYTPPTSALYLAGDGSGRRGDLRQDGARGAVRARAAAPAAGEPDEPRAASPLHLPYVSPISPR